ncbi:hypothetical protein C7999DRAFT_28608 [Corynascus novoguineensis]|uniref:Uncharacterized protein n=1 Tax=Corynascus novoguineensis TaxID=1126955 RepID=A0AAN7CYW5_9PEZI|nr:hypothetical protein C7999DRAFT_28608 [Corynascus novoguineensis]
MDIALLARPIPNLKQEEGTELEQTLAVEEPKTVAHIVPAQELERTQGSTVLDDTPIPVASYDGRAPAVHPVGFYQRPRGAAAEARRGVEVTYAG